MLILKAQHSFTWPVTVDVPVDNGAIRKETFKVEYKSLSQDELDEILDVTQENRDLSLLNEVVLGATDIKDEDKNPLEFDEEVKALLLSVPYVRRAMAQTYFDAMAGRKHKRKN